MTRNHRTIQNRWTVPALIVLTTLFAWGAGAAGKKKAQLPSYLRDL